MSKEKIISVTDEVRDMLIQKNEAYGNSALKPITVFSKGNSAESLCARIDDKLARIQNVGITDETEDTLFDLAGYLILLIIALKTEEQNHNEEVVGLTDHYFKFHSNDTIRKRNAENEFGQS